ncbi:MAG: DUF4304 domain-containing protein [Phycisphaerae bacterium]
MSIGRFVFVASAGFCGIIQRVATRVEYMKRVGEALYPGLRAEGFSGSGETLRKRLGEVVQVVNVQGGSAADRCYVNLGIHLSFLPEVGSTSREGCNPKTVKPSQCVIQSRLKPPAEFQFGFPYGATAAETKRSVEALVAAWRDQSPAFFRQLSAFPEDFLRITPEDVRQGASPLGALHCARIAFHLGDITAARAFAQVGYDLVTAKSGERSAVYFKRILDNPNPPAYWTGWCPSAE